MCSECAVICEYRDAFVVDANVPHFLRLAKLNSRSICCDNKFPIKLGPVNDNCIRRCGFELEGGTARCMEHKTAKFVKDDRTREPELIKRVGENDSCAMDRCSGRCVLFKNDNTNTTLREQRRRIQSRWPTADNNH